uniref:Uncharacterized protein n=1 Tax=Avena sativa TaxID=4498 RepID=A0ACD5VKV2_AVESA
MQRPRTRTAPPLSPYKKPAARGEAKQEHTSLGKTSKTRRTERAVEQLTQKEEATMAQQVTKAAELQDPEIREELDRRAREEGETVIKSGTGGKSLEAQERLAEGRKKGGRSRTDASGNERAEEDGGVLIEPDEKALEEVKKDLGRE